MVRCYNEAITDVRDFIVAAPPGRPKYIGATSKQLMRDYLVEEQIVANTAVPGNDV